MDECDVPCRDGESKSMDGANAQDSPKQGPMAFTIDFGDAKVENKPKKFNLKDGIKRFAPLKKSSAVVTKTKVTSATASAPLPEIPNLVDRENNNNEVVDQGDNKFSQDVGDACSDTGTYTIDEEEESKDKLKDEEDETSGLDIPKFEPQEYVSQWAASSTGTYCSSESPNSSIEPRDDNSSRSR